MAKTSNKIKDNPQLLERELKDGRTVYYLEYYLGRKQEPVLDEYGDPVFYTVGAMKGKPKYKVTHIRKKETLPFYKITKPRTPIEREENRKIDELARTVRYEKEQEFKTDKTGYKLKREKEKINLHTFFNEYIQEYSLKDKKNLKLAYKRFMDFLSLSKKYKKYTKNLDPDSLDFGMLSSFADYLKASCQGEGAHSLFARFKKMCRVAMAKELITGDPFVTVIGDKKVTIRFSFKNAQKDVLSLDEIHTLLNTHYLGENPNIQRAFALTLRVGIRFCDIRELTYANVDYERRQLTFRQLKTGEPVRLPLNDTLLDIIGKPADPNVLSESIFKLPSHTMCLKALRHWVSRAGINKHITWHCGRHTAGTNLLDNGASLRTVAAILGHSTTKHTERYVKAVPQSVIDAIDNISL